MYCREHGTNSPCVSCEIQKQTKEIVRAINEIERPVTLELKNLTNEYTLCYRFFSKTIMKLGKDGFFHEDGKESGVLVKREHGGETWYHRPADYLEWKKHLRI